LLTCVIDVACGLLKKFKEKIACSWYEKEIMNAKDNWVKNKGEE